MAFSVQWRRIRDRAAADGGSTCRKSTSRRFVDVVLVLLIIFMLTAHVMEFGIEVDVPKTKYVKDTAQEMPVVTITKDGRHHAERQAGEYSRLAAMMRQKFPEGQGRVRPGRQGHHLGPHRAGDGRVGRRRSSR